MLDHLQFLSERNCSPLSIDGKLLGFSGASKIGESRSPQKIRGTINDD